MRKWDVLSVAIWVVREDACHVSWCYIAAWSSDAPLVRVLEALQSLHCPHKLNNHNQAMVPQLCCPLYILVCASGLLESSRS